MKIKSVAFAAVLAASLPLLTLSIPAFAAGEHGGGHGDGIHGAPGNPGDVSRTIKIVMYDNYYEPESIEVEEGQTVRFEVTNAGEFVHEFSIATAEMHKAHAPEMMMMMEHGVIEADRINLEAAKQMQATMGHGMHEEGNSVLLEPGKTGEVIWKFPEHAAIEFACNVPGHYDSGMVGKIKLSH